MVHIPPGRRGALAAASAAVVCLGAFAALGPDCEGNGAGYVAVGAPGPAGGPGVNVPPSGDVDLVPLDGRTASPSAPGRTSPAAPDAPRAPDGRGGAGSPPPADAPERPGATGTPSGQGGTATPSGGPTGLPAPGGSASSSSPPAPGAPARLVVGAVERSAAAERWCEKVTVTLANTGDRAATAGTITFGTHVIGLLGVDWATVRSSRAAPVPVPGGGSAKGTWEVCVEAWRVPPGMHVETRDVSVADS